MTRNPGVTVVKGPSGLRFLKFNPVPLHSEGLAGALGLDGDVKPDLPVEQIRRNRDYCNAINEIRRQHLGLWLGPLSPTAQEIADNVIEREGPEGFARRLQADLDDYHHVAEFVRQKWAAP